MNAVRIAVVGRPLDGASDGLAAAPQLLSIEAFTAEAHVIPTLDHSEDVLGRRTKYSEFLNTLMELTALKPGEFAAACGKKSSNMSDYLSGKKRPGRETAASAVRHLRETWDVVPTLEIEPLPKPRTKISTAPGVYAFFSESGETLYVGQAANLQTEIGQTLNRAVNFPLRRGPNLSKKAKPKFKDVVARISAYEVRSARLRHNLEALLLRVYANAAHNNKMGKFK